MILGKTHRMPECRCLACGTMQSAATAIADDAQPIAGSIVVCIECGHLMAFDEQLQFRALTEDEIYAVAGDPRILAVQLARTKVAEDE